MNEQNLIPQAHVLTVEDQSKGGKASVAARRRRKTMREAAEELLSRNYTDKSGNEVDGTTALVTKAFMKAMDGDMRSLEFLRDLVGEMPVKQVDLTGTLTTEAKFTELLEKYGV